MPVPLLAFLATLGGLVLVTRFQPSTGAAMTSGPPAIAEPPAGSAVVAAGTGTRPGTVLGRLVTTDFGHIQVQLSVSHGKITAAQVVHVPEDGGGHGRRINARALPILNLETVKAQSARIDAVSGATISSNGYRQSLQSAIDALHQA